MDSKQWFGIFIAVIMIGSILGFALMFSGNQGQESNPDVNPDLPDSTVLNMFAENIDAKVVEALPKVLFSAYTNEADITLINKKVASVTGVYTINSKYRQTENSSFGTSLVYIAEISFDKEKSLEEITSELNSVTQEILFDPVYFQTVLINVPKNVRFSNEQGFDLDYEYADPLTVAYVLPGTLKGDNLSVRIDGSFTGNTLVSSFASVLKNLTAEPKILNFDLNKTVEEKLPRIVFGSYTTYSTHIEDDFLKEQISVLAEVADVNIASLKPDNYFTVFFEAETDLNTELNQFLQDNKEYFISIEVFAAGQGFSAQIYFDENYSLTELFPLVSAVLTDSNASGISFSEAVGQVFASISLTSSDSAQTVLELNSLLDSLNFTETQIQQEAVVEFDSFANEEGKEFISDEQTITEIFVSPEVQVGEEVNLKVEVETVRDKLVSIRAASE